MIGADLLTLVDAWRWAVVVGLFGKGVLKWKQRERRRGMPSRQAVVKLRGVVKINEEVRKPDCQMVGDEVVEQLLRTLDERYDGGARQPTTMPKGASAARRAPAARAAAAYRGMH